MLASTAGAIDLQCQSHGLTCSSPKPCRLWLPIRTGTKNVLSSKRAQEINDKTQTSTYLLLSTPRETQKIIRCFACPRQWKRGGVVTVRNPAILAKGLFAAMSIVAKVASVGTCSPIFVDLYWEGALQVTCVQHPLPLPQSLILVGGERGLGLFADLFVFCGASHLSSVMTLISCFTVLHMTRSWFFSFLHVEALGRGFAYDSVLR